MMLRANNCIKLVAIEIARAIWKIELQICVCEVYLNIGVL